VKRLGVLLAVIGLALMTGMSSATATPPPDHAPGAVVSSSGLPPGCYLTGGSFTAAPSSKASAVNLAYRGIGFVLPTCNPGGVFRITINLWTETGTHWAWTYATSEWVTTVTSTSIAAGVITDSCKHLATVKGVINYIVGSTKTAYTTNVTHCS